jgi:hypothetical protein
MHRLVIAFVFAILSLSLPALAQAPSGTAGEAKEMLTKAIAAVKADKAKAIEMFNKGEGGFKDRDLYPFCVNVSDGKVIANSFLPQLIGQDNRTFKDSTGHNFGQAFYDTMAKAKDGEIVESAPFLFPRPGPDKTPVAKVAYLSKTADIYCGVGYYK